MLYSSRLLILVATLLLISCTPNAVKSGATGSPTSTEPKAGAESGAASSPASAYPGPGAESDTADGQTNAYPEPGAAGSQASAYPGPGEEGAQPSPIPTTSIVEPNEIIGMPHFASPTPPPTPTRRPGPTPTAVPTKPLPSTAAGEIHYRTYIRTYIDDGDHRTYQFWTQPVDAEGAPRGEPQELAVPDQLNNPPDYAYLSPNGDYLIFMQPSMPGGVPYVIKTESGTGRPLYEEPYGGGRFFGWHPDGRHFLFWIDTVGLWLADAETLEITTLSLPYGLVQGAAISPDGQQIVYLDAIPGEQSYYLSLVSSAGSDARPLFPAGLSAYMLDDAWSPDGAHVLFAGNCTETEGGLCMVNMQTMERQLVRVPDGVGDAPRWSPDGKVIAYAGIIEGETRCDHVRKDREPVACDYEALGVYLIEVDTGTTTFLARGRLPVWSPDGSMLAFLSYESGMPEIWSIQRDGGNLRQVTADGLFKDLFSGLTWRN